MQQHKLCGRTAGSFGPAPMMLHETPTPPGGSDENNTSRSRLAGKRFLRHQGTLFFLSLRGFISIRGGRRRRRRRRRSVSCSTGDALVAKEIVSSLHRRTVLTYHARHRCVLK